MNIELKTSYDEHNKIARYTTFEILDEQEAQKLKDELILEHDLLNGFVKVKPINLDIEEKNEMQITHKFYKIEDEIYDTIRNIAVPAYINIHIETYPAAMNIILETFEGEERLRLEVDRGFYIEDYIDEIIEHFGYLQDDFIEHIKLALNMFGYDWM